MFELEIQCVLIYLSLRQCCNVLCSTIARSTDSHILIDPLGGAIELVLRANQTYHTIRTNCFGISNPEHISGWVAVRL